MPLPDDFHNAGWLSSWLAGGGILGGGGFWLAIRYLLKVTRSDGIDSAAIARLQKQIDDLSKRLDASESRYEAERILRRQVEDDLDKERRRVAALEDHVAELERGT